MRRTAYLGLFLVFVTMAAPAFAQQINDPAEYDIYFNKIYKETDAAKQAAAAEKFLADYPKTTALPHSYMFMIRGYYRAGNFQKALDSADKQPTLGKDISAEDKNQVLLIGMDAATRVNNKGKQREYVDKILAGDPKNVTALVALSTLLADATTLPADDPGKQKRFDETLVITRRALAEPPPTGVNPTQWNPVLLQLRHTECLVLLNQKKNSESIEACRAALKIDPKDGYAYYLIGLNLTPGYNEASKKYTDAVDNFNKNRDKGQLVTDDLKAEIEGASKAQDAKKEELIDVLARAVACGGQGAAALKPLQQLFMGTPAEYDELIKAKKAALGIAG